MFDRVEVYHAHFVGFVLGVDEPLVVGREFWQGDFAHRVDEKSTLRLCSHIHEHGTVSAVGVENVLAIVAPSQAANVGVVARSELRVLAVDGGVQPYFGFARSVADVGNGFTVGTPSAVAVVNAR